MLLEINDVCSGYKELKVLFNVNMNIDKGECVALVGANGSGKTTLLRTISGTIPITDGEILWDGQDISNLAAESRPQLGIAHIPQGRGIFAGLTIYDNLMIGGYCRRAKVDKAKNLEMVLNIFPILKDRLKFLAGSLSGGQQQMLAIARALMLNPTLLVLDEPSLGLAPIIVDEIFQIIVNLKSREIAILLVEQNLVKALEIAERGYVLETGQIKIEGTANSLMQNDAVRKSYLGL